MFLKERVTFEYGYSVRVDTELKGNYPVFGSNGITGYIDSYKVEGPGVIIGRKGSVGSVKYTEKNYTPTDTAYYVSLIDKKRDDLKFWYYYLQLLGLEKLNTHSSVPGLSREIAYFVNVNPPDFISQQKIASVLSVLDSKIELNNRINSELESMAKTLYDYWFVQFDYPDKNRKPYKSSGGKMVWNEELKREIPEGWGVGKLTDCIELIIDNRGKTPKKLGGDWSLEKESIIALSAKIVKEGKLVNLDQANKVSREMYNKWMPTKLQDGDVLMTSEAPAGEFYFIYGFKEYCLSQRLFAMRANKNVVVPSYFYYELSKGHAYSQIMGSLSGSTVFGIRQDVLRDINILVPNLSIQAKFDSIVIPLMEKIKNHDFQNQKLTELRDWLLPMLMNGQVKVE